MKIYLSPSDQWSNITATNHSEAEHCTNIAKELGSILVKAGHDVILGDNNKQGTYADRIKSSNNWGSDLHICIHTNAGGGSGTLMLTKKPYDSNTYVKGIYTHVANLTPTKDRGIQLRNDIYEINKANMPIAYLEVDFHDNRECEKWIDSNISNIAYAIARGIGVNDKPENEKLYRVQCGAYKIKSNSYSQIERLKRLNYDAFAIYENGVYKVICGSFKSKDNANKRVEELKKKGITCLIS